MIITIAGESGSGKTTIGKKLSQILNYEFYSIGDFRGEMALKRGMTIDELNKLGEKEKWTDKEADDYQKELGKKQDNFIIEGRLSWYFIPNSFKIFFNVNEKIGAQRIIKNPRKDEKKINSIEEMIKYNLEKKQSNIARYERYYKINPYEQKYYDLIIDTSNLKIEQAIGIILNKIK